MSLHIRPLATCGTLFWLFCALTSQTIIAAGSGACHMDCMNTGQRLQAPDQKIECKEEM